MARFPRDPNNVPTVGGTSTVDGLTPLPISATRLTNSTALATQLVDGSGNQITSFGGGTQYTDGATTPATPTGTMPVFDNGGTIAKVSAAQGLPVNIIAGAGSGGTATTDGGTFTAGVTSGTPAMGAYHSVIDTVTDGKAAIVGMTSKRAMLTNLQNSSGVEVATASNPLQVSLANTAANATAIKMDGSAVTQPVSGTFWQATQPVSAAALPLPSGASTAAKQPALGVAGTASTDVLTVQGIASMTALKVDNSAVTQPVSGTVTVQQSTASSLKVDLSGTAANTTAIKVDNSAVTQPVSGTVTANAGTNLNTSALALESGGNLATVAGAVVAQEATTSGVKGLTAFGAVTTNAPTYVTTKSDALSLDTSGLLRVSLKDTPANTNKLLVTPDSVALPANQSVNISQINATTPLMGAGNGGTGSLRVNIASDQLSIPTAASEADGANVTLGAKADAKSTATDTTAISAMSVLKQISASVQAPPSQAVTNTGTFATQSTLAAETTKVIGTVNVAASQSIAATQATASSLNATVVGTGTFATQSTLAAETTKVIGTARTADGAGNLLTTNSTTYTAKFGLDGNLLGTLGTAFSTAGKVDVKGADGDVFVRQGTAANLKMDLSGSAANTTAGLFSVKVDQTAPGTTNAITPVPASNSGWSFSYQSALTGTAAQIKATAGTFGGWAMLYNPNTAVTFIQVFNKASASVTLGTTVPDFVIPLPGIASASATGSAANWESVHGLAMSTGITVAATTSATNATAPANAIVATFLYK